MIEVSKEASPEVRVMAHAAQFAATPENNLACDLPLALGGADKTHRADKLMTDFAAAFSLEMDFERETEIVDEKKWPFTLALVFALSVSAVLWALLVGAFFLL